MILIGGNELEIINEGSAALNDSPIRAFEAENSVIGFEFQFGKFLYLKPCENVERGSAVVFQKDIKIGDSSSLSDALALRDGSLVFMDSEDFDDFLNVNNIYAVIEFL